MELDHWLIVGQTKFGKSTFAKELAKWYKSRGIGVIVFDPMAHIVDHKEVGKIEWDADWITNDPEEFLAFVQDPEQCLQCALFFDEAGRHIDKADSRFEWLTSSARHHGHVSHIITWRGPDVSPGMRQNCCRIVAFNIHYDFAKELGKDFNSSLLLEAHTLPKGHYVYSERGGINQRKGKVWWAQ